MTGPTRTALSAVLAVALAGVLVVGLAGSAAAMDSTMTLRFDPSDLEAENGDEVTIDLVASTHGNLVGNGIVALESTIEYDSDVLTVTDVEHGPMLAAGDDDAEVDGTEEIDDEAGAVTIEQERVPEGDGAKATETAATLTFEVADDAPSTNETLEITDSSAMYPSGYSLNAIEREGSIEIDGTDDGDTVPGFAPLAALAALAATLWLVVRRD
ncbi:cohesin domain-containing protein [Natronolimnohabitans innermongolicus]|uniref:Cohesin domain-containing protein n=1 Tax=Natronolimnohabitans innermongolicus JCM 12255 TaxID=1227499 RepID=L9XLI0_9EURY|nr:cohesin domain-containing protein [Natronolimnohabitans innermongolicus]ELY62266.1 hypothetical protein C493_00530 [Natronolimnohabitans innermongolicus JCM 12255]